MSSHQEVLDIATIDKSPTLEAVKSLLPMLQARDTDAQHTYLSARYCGFSHSEACIMAKVNSDAIHRWRTTDEMFKTYESKIDDKAFREEVRKDTLTTLYFRNAFLISRKDAEILLKANNMLNIEYQEINEKGEYVTKHGTPPLTSFEKSYLLQIRKEYSPSQMAVLEKLLTGKDEGFSITDLIHGGHIGTMNVQVNNHAKD